MEEKSFKSSKLKPLIQEGSYIKKDEKTTLKLVQNS